MAKKKTFVLRINPEIMDALEKWAADDFRSINGQLEWIIHNALKDSKRLKKNTGEDILP
ncbi:MAG TPA: Arc family DNA-binding protein [Draconibacterium sp.]|nr:Arc family DNA-binding protein [Draconibacterium sp.]HRX10857.1 Arc family DNA-binding protein [Draconibacterium sp.]